MVGKGSEQNSRIFHQCYLNCCKLQNLTPLNYVIPSSNGKVLDFCVDRIKYQEWPPILNALSCDLSLHYVSIKCRQQVKTGKFGIRIIVNLDYFLPMIKISLTCYYVGQWIVSLTNSISRILSSVLVLHKYIVTC